jgi:hypothetical protein
MKNTTIALALTAPFSLVVAAPVMAAADPAAPVVMLRQSCTENGTEINNCFANFPALAGWMNGTRKPNASSPLRVDIGPGTFQGAYNPEEETYGDLRITCNPTAGYTGHTSFVGSGPEHTNLRGTGSPSTSSVNVRNCTELSFSDLKVTTNFYGGIYWNGGGNSQWKNVVVDGVARGWLEPECGAERGKHYWFGSKVSATAAFSITAPYVARCDETWFFGSEVKGVVPAGETSSLNGVAVAEEDGILHLYGSNLVALIDGGPVGANTTVPAALAQTGGHVHIHGTGIDVISTTGQNIVALQVMTGGMIHAEESAYNLQTTGTVTRIDNQGGMVKAPYQWTQASQPPTVLSETGADLAVETNCDGGSCHDENTGTETHLLIYNANCNVAGHGPWFDVVTGKCRGDMSAN